MAKQVRRRAIAIAASAMLAATVVGSASVAVADDFHGDRDKVNARDKGMDERDKGHGDQKVVQTKLSGYEEDPLTISTDGEGKFWAEIDEKEKKIEYRLSYEDLESPVTQAHIHFGGKRQSGGIVVFLCSNLPNPPAGTPNCPREDGTVSGTIEPEDVLALPNQGFDAGDFDDLLDAVEAGVTYVNVHTEEFPNGEIRGQIDDDHDR